MTSVYPSEPALRDRFVLEHRGPRAIHDPFQLQDYMLEDEAGVDGGVARVATIFLTGRECPWRCVMCDLWRHTISADTPVGALPQQIAQAVALIRCQEPAFPPHVKLYNAGSFFDPRAVPERDYDTIAFHLTGFSRVIVESHPALIGPRVEAFQRSLHDATLEVAMGLETAHPDALERLNKRMTLDDFKRAAGALGDLGVGVRVFLLVRPPFVADEDQDDWLARSVDTAFACGAAVVSLIPVRSTTGAMSALAAEGLFREPRLADLERAFAAALSRSRGRVFADLWDLGRFTDCGACGDARRDRLVRMNRAQQIAPPVVCPVCGGSVT